MPRPAARIAAAVVAALLCTPCAAQLVVVQPGYVKAPFVRVYTNPDGSSYVRAPFVGVYSPPQYPPLGPTAEELADADWYALRRVARHAGSMLDAELRQFPTGDVWRSHFQTRELPQLVRGDVESPPSAEEQAKLAELAAVYDTAEQSADLRAIVGLDSFRVLNAALRELATPAMPRMRRQLARSSRRLDRALTRLNTGESWQKYLALPETLVAPPPKEDEPPRPPLDLDELAKIRDRYESVNQNENYRGVARLPAFQTTRQLLAQYVDRVQTERKP